MQIYNTDGMDNNKRFVVAILVGIAAAIGLGLIYGVILSFVRIQMQVFYLFIGWAVGALIQKYGRGVGKRFCVVGALCTLLAIIIGDLCSMYGLDGILFVIIHPASWGNAIRLWMQMNLSTNISSIIGLLLRAMGIVFGYRYSSLF